MGTASTGFNDRTALHPRTTLKIAGDLPVAAALANAANAMTDLNFLHALAQAPGGSLSRLPDGPVPGASRPIAISTLSTNAMVVLLSLCGLGGLLAIRRQG